jgi:hypothetical protein
MIHFNPVQDDKDKDCVERGLFLVNNDLYSMLTQQKIRNILLTNAPMEDGQDEVAKYFQVKKQKDALLDQWHEEKKVIIGFKRYYELLFFVKSVSEVDHVWFSFFKVKGMHRHAAIVAGLVCSKFNHLTKELEPGSLTLEYFRNENIKSFKEPNTTVSDHLNQIMSKQFDAPMVQNQFHLSAYVPKQTRMRLIWSTQHDYRVYVHQILRELWGIQQYLKSLPIGWNIHYISAQKTQE